MSKYLIAAALAVAAGTAQAHITFEASEAPIAATQKFVLRVPHGCEGAATTRVRIRIPEGVIAVKPMPKPGWELATVSGPYQRPYAYYGADLTEGVTEIAWTGSLPDAYYDEFAFRGMLSDSLAAGSELYFPVVQECGDAAERWIEIPAAGQDPDSLDFPAPGLKLLPAAPGH